MISINPEAGALARRLDSERNAGDLRGPLHGLPILIKDNIETADPMATTAGSLALKDNVAGLDAPLVARLRAAGAVIMGKTNLSEWANYRSRFSISGWSAVGGQCRNAHDPARGPCGSSSGSAVAVAAGYAAAAIGTETDGSITCPASVNGVVGLKPTVGLVSRRRIVPISASQDTAGPITRTVRDAALVLSVIAGADPLDPATRRADARKIDYAAGLDNRALRGARIGIMRAFTGYHPGTDSLFEAALKRLSGAGAVLIEITMSADRRAIGAAESIVMRTEFKAGLNAYLAAADPRQVATRSVADLIAFNIAHAEAEMPLFGQDLLIAAQAAEGLTDPVYLQALKKGRRLAGRQGIDRMLGAYDVAALIAPTMGPAALIDTVLPDRYLGSSLGGLPAVAGYPHLTVPMGEVGGMPVGLSFIGAAWSDGRLLALGHAFERAGRKATV
jgi:amidase